MFNEQIYSRLPARPVQELQILGPLDREKALVRRPPRRLAVGIRASLVEIDRAEPRVAVPAYVRGSLLARTISRGTGLFPPPRLLRVNSVVRGGKAARLGRRRRAGPNRVEIDIHAARQQGRLVEQPLALITTFKEAPRATVFLVCAAGDRLGQAPHQPRKFLPESGSSPHKKARRTHRCTQ